MNSDEKSQQRLMQTFEFKLTRYDGEETTIRQTFPQGTDIWGVSDLFRNFLLAVTYSSKTINSILTNSKEL